MVSEINACLEVEGYLIILLFTFTDMAVTDQSKQTVNKRLLADRKDANERSGDAKEYGRTCQH